MTRTVLLFSTGLLNLVFWQTAHSATYDIPDGDVAALKAAIEASDDSPEADVINLAPDGLYILTEAIGEDDEATGLTSPGAGTVLNGRGATLQRSTDEGTPAFRILTIEASDADITIRDLTFSNGNAAAGDGGALHTELEDGILYIENCTFTDNSALYEGGAIFSVYGDDVEINNSVFTNNSAGERGGAIMTGDIMRINDSRFANNTAEMEGGAIYNEDECYISDTDFESNSVPNGQGGAIFNDDELVIDGGVFEANSALQGAGIFNYGDLIWTNGVARANTGTNANRGGAGLYELGGETVIENVLFEENTAGRGAAVWIEYGDPQFTNCTFLRNSAATWGGAILNEDEVVLIDCVFTDNTTTDDFAAGGAIYARSFERDDTITQIFGGRISGSTGGAISNVKGDLLAIDVLFEDNTNVGSGGAITMFEGLADIQECRFLGNSVTVSTGQTGSGGAVYNAVSTSKTRIDRSFFKGNSAERLGGAIYSISGELFVQRSVFLENSVTGLDEFNSGGGAIGLSNTVFEARNCTFSANTTPRRGGALFSGSGSDQELNSCTFADNSSTGSGSNTGGGALFLALSSLRVGNCVFSGNTSATEGPNISGTFESLGFNLISDPAGATINGTTTGNITGQDAGLGVFQDTGSYASVHRPLDGSPVLDAGRSDTGATAVFDDQFGFSRPRDLPGVADASGSDGADMGAVERFPDDTLQTGDRWVVNTRDGGFDGICGDDHCSLADAILASESGDTSLPIEFAEAAFPAAGDPATILLNSPLPQVRGSLEIRGNPDQPITVRRNPGPGTADFRILNITASGNALISGMSFENGIGTDPDYGDVPIGGCILNNGALVLRQCAVRDGWANIGGGIYNAGSLLLIRCLIERNTVDSIRANGRGGGLYVDRGSTTRIVDSLFLENEATEANNRPAFGGGIGAFDHVSVSGTTFSGNRATQAAGMEASTLDMDGCLFYGNEAVGFAGALRSNRPVSIVNTTFTGNTATSFDGGALNLSIGTVLHCTITDNTAGRNGGGIYLRSDNLVNIGHTIIAGNSAGEAGQDVQGPPTSLGYNLIGNAEESGWPGSSATHLAGMDPQLSALADNGGPTMTRASSSGSPVRDAGNEAFTAPPYSDQRGSPRVMDGRIDIGAYEHGAYSGPIDYATWATGYSLSGASASPDVDADGDGYANAAEFALGSDPGDSSSVPSGKFSASIASGVATLQIQKAARISGCTLRVEWSRNGMDWSPLGLEVTVNSPEVLEAETTNAFQNAFFRFVAYVDE